MNVSEIKAYLRTAPMDEVNLIASAASARIRQSRNSIKRELSPGMTVTSDNERFPGSSATLVSVLKKYAVCEFPNKVRYKVPITWLKEA